MTVNAAIRVDAAVPTNTGVSIRDCGAPGRRRADANASVRAIIIGQAFVGAAGAVQTLARHPRVGRARIVPVHGVPVRRYGDKPCRRGRRAARLRRTAVLRRDLGGRRRSAAAAGTQLGTSGAPFVTELSLHPGSATAQTNAISRPNLGASICRIGASDTLNFLTNRARGGSSLSRRLDGDVPSIGPAHSGPLHAQRGVDRNR